VTVQERIKTELDRHGITREMVEKRAADLHSKGRRNRVDLNALSFSAGVVAAMLELMAAARRSV
jgi:hypothetical protein